MPVLSVNRLSITGSMPCACNESPAMSSWAKDGGIPASIQEVSTLSPTSGLKEKSIKPLSLLDRFLPEWKEAAKAILKIDVNNKEGDRLDSKRLNMVLVHVTVVVIAIAVAIVAAHFLGLTPLQVIALTSAFTLISGALSFALAKYRLTNMTEEALKILIDSGHEDAEAIQHQLDAVKRRRLLGSKETDSSSPGITLTDLREDALMTIENAQAAIYTHDIEIKGKTDFLTRLREIDEELRSGKALSSQTVVDLKEIKNILQAELALKELRQSAFRLLDKAKAAAQLSDLGATERTHILARCEEIDKELRENKGVTPKNILFLNDIQTHLEEERKEALELLEHVVELANYLTPQKKSDLLEKLSVMRTEVEDYGASAKTLHSLAELEHKLLGLAMEQKAARKATIASPFEDTEPLVEAFERLTRFKGSIQIPRTAKAIQDHKETLIELKMLLELHPRDKGILDLTERLEKAIKRGEDLLASAEKAVLRHIALYEETRLDILEKIEANEGKVLDKNTLRSVQAQLKQVSKTLQQEETEELRKVRGVLLLKLREHKEAPAKQALLTKELTQIEAKLEALKTTIGSVKVSADPIRFLGEAQRELLERREALHETLNREFAKRKKEQDAKSIEILEIRIEALDQLHKELQERLGRLCESVPLTDAEDRYRVS
jgi:hypothetical protein